MRNAFSSSSFLAGTKAIKKDLIHAGLVLATSALLITAKPSFAQTQQLPISSFVDAQPVGTVICWSDPANGNLLCFDHVGKRAALFNVNLGTSISGRVAVRDLQNGTQVVSVDVITTDAACWGFDTNGLAFGRPPVQIAKGAAASLGNGRLTLDFTQPTGAPMPTIDQIFSNSNAVTFISLKTSVLCPHGELIPSGAPGFAQTTQTILLNTGVPGGCPPEQDADCSPAEIVQFKPTGR